MRSLGNKIDNIKVICKQADAHIILRTETWLYTQEKLWAHDGGRSKSTIDHFITNLKNINYTISAEGDITSQTPNCFSKKKTDRNRNNKIKRTNYNWMYSNTEGKLEENKIIMNLDFLIQIIREAKKLSTAIKGQRKI